MPDLFLFLFFFCRHFNAVDADTQREMWTLLLKGNHQVQYVK